MKIIFAGNGDLSVYTQRKELVESFLQKGYEVILSCPNSEKIQKLVKQGCKLYETKFERKGTNPFKDIQLYNFYKKMIRDIKPDIVLTFTIKPNIYMGLACKKYKIPYIANITGLGTAVEVPGILQKITCFLYKKALSKAKTVFFQNKENEEFFSKRKIAPDVHKFLPGSGVNLQEHQLVDYPKGKTIKFVFVARIMREKGIDEYLAAAKYFKDNNYDVEFNICGFCEKNYETYLDEFQEKNIINYRGMVSNMHEIYKEMHCTIHPTFYPEGLSNVLLESCATGRPIITTNRSGCREVVEDGVNGFVVKEKDSEDLISKIKMFLKMSYDEKKQMGLSGRKKVEDNFDRKTVVEKYLEEIEVK